MLVDHDVQVLREADWFIEIGPGSGSDGGTVLAEGTLDDLVEQPGVADRRVPRRHASRSAYARRSPPSDCSTTAGSAWPPARCTPCTPSTSRSPRAGSPRSPASPGPARPRWFWRAWCRRCRPRRPASRCPRTSRRWTRRASARVNVVDATPIGTNVRSTVATYSGVLDDLRRAYAATRRSRRAAASPPRTSPTTPDPCAARAARAPGQISLDVQFLPDVDIPCPDCDGTRYCPCRTRDPARRRRRACRCPSCSGSP